MMRLDVCDTPRLCPLLLLPPLAPARTRAGRPNTPVSTLTRAVPLALLLLSSFTRSLWTNPTSTPDTLKQAPVTRGDGNELAGAQVHGGPSRGYISRPGPIRWHSPPPHTPKNMLAPPKRPQGASVLGIDRSPAVWSRRRSRGTGPLRPHSRSIWNRRSPLTISPLSPLSIAAGIDRGKLLPKLCRRLPRRRRTPASRRPTPPPPKRRLRREHASALGSPCRRPQRRR